MTSAGEKESEEDASTSTIARSPAGHHEGDWRRTAPWTARNCTTTSVRLGSTASTESQGLARVSSPRVHSAQPHPAAARGETGAMEKGKLRATTTPSRQRMRMIIRGASSLLSWRTREKKLGGKRRRKERKKKKKKSSDYY